MAKLNAAQVKPYIGFIRLAFKVLQIGFDFTTTPADLEYTLEE